MSEFPITFSALKSFSIPKAAAGQASRQAGRQAGRAALAAAELPLSVNRCRPNVVHRRLSSSSFVVDENEMPNKRPWMEFRRRRRAREHERCGRDKRGKWRRGAHGRYDLIMIKEPLAAQPPSSYFHRRRSRLINERYFLRSPFLIDSLIHSLVVRWAPVLYMVLPSC